MSDPYQLGSDLEWLKHTNDELSRLVKKRNAQLSRVRLFCLVLALALGWVIYRFSRTQPLEELWRFDSRSPASLSARIPDQAGRPGSWTG